VAAHAHPQGGRAADRPRLEVADIIRAHGEAFARAHVLLPEQHAVLRDIGRCRTAALGGYVDVCAACGAYLPTESTPSAPTTQCQGSDDPGGELRRIVPTRLRSISFFQNSSPLLSTTPPTQSTVRLLTASVSRP